MTPNRPHVFMQAAGASRKYIYLFPALAKNPQLPDKKRVQLHNSRGYRPYTVLVDDVPHRIVWLTWDGEVPAGAFE